MTDWNRIVRDHGPMVFGTAWRVLGHTADTEDVVQEVFLEAHRLGQAQPVRHWGGLLRRLAAYRALDRLRQRKVSVPLDGLALLGSGDAPEEQAIGRELAERLRQAVAQLPEREGSVFCLRCFEDLSYEQIAETLDISRGAVATALHKARAKLEALLTEVVKGD
ncbi:MAG TPA: sigma-70 family RNA polymerase sigma factor [Gemmataceae bacterium]|nr:sigma-70 family RNA polymerase sigma factor [Gemmataceae bacterium]